MIDTEQLHCFARGISLTDNPISENVKTRLQLSRDLTGTTLDFGLTPARWRYPCPLHQLYELSCRCDAELLHQRATVDLDGFLRHAKLTADLFI